MRVVQWLEEMGERGREILRDPEIPFGVHVKHLRQINGWSQRELASRMSDEVGLKLDASAITRIEGGRSVTLRQAVALAYTLGAESLDMMLDEPPEPDPEVWLVEMKKGVDEMEARVRDFRTKAEIGDQLLQTRLQQISELEAQLQAGRDEAAAEAAARGAEHG